MNKLGEKMVWSNIEYHEDEEYIKVPSSWLHVHYYEALNILFRFENSLRVFVYVILKDKLKNNWSNTSVNSDNTIKKIAGIRISQAKDYGYLCYDIKSPMLYLSSGDLIDVIMHDSNWKYFKKYFKAKKEIIKHKLLEIGAVRNSLAHFRPIQNDDLDVIKQNVKHTLSIVDEFLGNITSIYNLVPTNTEHDWYIRLKELNSTNITLSIYQDKKLDWIKIAIIFKGKVFKVGYKSKTYKSFSVSKLSSINLLNIYKEIKENITYLNEDFSSSIDDDKLNFSKYINLIISKQNLKDNLPKIIEDIEDFIKTVEHEIELLSADDLADTIDRYDGSEFWGRNRYIFSAEYLTTSSQYPWMPTEVSQSNFIDF